MNHHLPILLADWDDLLKGLVPVAFLLIWVISQLVDAKKVGKAGGNQAAAPKPPRPRQLQQPPQGGAPARPGQPAQGGAMRDQVEEFLQRAGRPARPDQHRPAADPLDPAAARREVRPAAARPPQDVEVLLNEGRKVPERGPLAQPLRPLSQRAGDPAEAVLGKGGRPRRPAASEPSGESVAEYVSEHVDATARALGEHASHLGERVIQADEQFDVQLKAKFDHKLGKLASQRDSNQPDQPVAVDSPAAQIAAMLADPAGVRQAIVLSEILNRPSDRW